MASESEQELSKLTVVELKDIIRAYKLPVSGAKAALISRIIEYQLNNPTINKSPISKPSTSTPNPSSSTIIKPPTSKSPISKPSTSTSKSTSLTTSKPQTSTPKPSSSTKQSTKQSTKSSTSKTPHKSQPNTNEILIALKQQTTVFSSQIQQLIDNKDKKITLNTIRTRNPVRVYKPTYKDFGIFAEAFALNTSVVSLTISDIVMSVRIGKSIKKMLMTGRITSLSITNLLENYDKDNNKWLTEVNAGMSHSPHLKHLTMFDVNLDIDNIITTLPSLNTMEGLKLLNLSYEEYVFGTAIEAPDRLVFTLNHLINRGLEVLILRNINLSDAISPLEGALANSRTLKLLDINYSYISNNDAAALSRMLSHNISIKILAVSRINSMLQHIPHILSNNNTLEKIDISQSKISSPLLQNIRDSMLLHRKILSINIRATSLSDDSGPVIVQLIDDNVLESLDISINSFEDTLPAIGQALGKNTSLKKLYMQRILVGPINHINILEQFMGNEPATNTYSNEFLTEIAKNTTLEYINMSGGYIGDNGYVLADLIKNNQHLSTLAVEGTYINDEGAIEIINALVYNETLTQLDIGFNNISEVHKNKIDVLVERNKKNASAKNVPLLDVLIQLI